MRLPSRLGVPFAPSVQAQGSRRARGVAYLQSSTPHILLQEAILGYLFPCVPLVPRVLRVFYTRARAHVGETSKVRGTKGTLWERARSRPCKVHHLCYNYSMVSSEHYLQADAQSIPLPADSVDLVVTSPPYAMLRKSTYGGIPEVEYIEWFMPIAADIARVLKPGGSFILNINASQSSEHPGKSTYVYELVIALCRAGWIWHEEYIWHKVNPYPGRYKNKFADAYEPLYHFARTPELATFNRESVKVQRATRPAKVTNKLRPNHNGNKYQVRGYNPSMLTPDKYPTNVISAPVATEPHGHSAAFPSAIPRFFIALLTNQGDTVLDPFSGSGTTASTANAMLRKGIGCDILHQYGALAHNRRQRMPALL